METPRQTISMAGRLSLLLMAGIVVYEISATAVLRMPLAAAWLNLPMERPHEVAARLAAAAVGLIFVTWAASRVFRPLTRTLENLSDGIRSFRDRDFSVRLAQPASGELGTLLRLYNEVGQTLQEERSLLRQRELLLQSALDHSPSAIVLVNPLERILYANREARQLFLGGGKLEGYHFGEVVDACPDEMRQVLASGRDGIFTVDRDDDPETFHLAFRGFALNSQRHQLLLLRRLTAELSRQEVEIWKKVIRIISHELNNSLAPISSLAHSARTIARESEVRDRLGPIFQSIRGRVEHLSRFLEGYARYARLPEPQLEKVDWAEWIEGPRRIYPFLLEGPLPNRPGYFDPSQIQQALINLLKNAVEASGQGDPEIKVGIQRLQDGRVRISVMDRGEGMSEATMRQALLPFYSTKTSGAGVGLPLCREIVEAHGGHLQLQNRPEGGLEASFWLPQGEAARNG